MASSPGTGWSNGPKLDPGSFNPETRDGKTAHHPPQPAPQTTGVQRAGAEPCPKLLRAEPGRVRGHARMLPMWRERGVGGVWPSMLSVF